MSNRQSYLAKQEANRKSRQAAGLLSEKYPNVEKIVIDMVYYQNLANPVLMLRTLNVFPTSYAYFKMDCMIKECEEGFFELGPVIKGMVKNRKKVLRDGMKCKGGLNRKEIGPDHASIEYVINVTYGRKVPKKTTPVKAEPMEKVEVVSSAKKVAPKKAAPKKAAPKKAAPKKTAPKKAAPKKAAPKKAAPKKAAPKKAAPKKAAPKKAAPKKAAPKKKAPAKKTAARKTSKKR